MDGVLLVLCVAALWIFALTFWKVSMEIDRHMERDAKRKEREAQIWKAG